MPWILLALACPGAARHLAYSSLRRIGGLSTLPADKQVSRTTASNRVAKTKTTEGAACNPWWRRHSWAKHGAR